MNGSARMKRGQSVLGARAQGARLERVRASPRFRDGRFHNSRSEARPRLETSPLPLLGELFFSGAQRKPPGPLPMLDPLASWDRKAETGLRVTWLGHSTLLLELDGMRVLTRGLGRTQRRGRGGGFGRRGRWRDARADRPRAGLEGGPGLKAATRARRSRACAAPALDRPVEHVARPPAAGRARVETRSARGQRVAGLCGAEAGHSRRRPWPSSRQPLDPGRSGARKRAFAPALGR